MSCRFILGLADAAAYSTIVAISMAISKDDHTTAFAIMETAYSSGFAIGQCSI